MTRACPSLPVKGQRAPREIFLHLVLPLPNPRGCWVIPPSQIPAGIPPYLQALSPRALVTLQRRPVGLSPMLPTTASRTYCLCRDRAGLREGLREGLQCPPAQPAMEIPAQLPPGMEFPAQPPPGLTYFPHFTHSSTNMFPWSSANLSLWEEGTGELGKGVEPWRSPPYSPGTSRASLHSSSAR